MMPLFAALLSVTASATDLVIVAEQVFTVSGDVIEDGVVYIEDGRITKVGHEDDLPIPEGTPHLQTQVLTPGLVDGLSVAGLTGVMNQGNDQDHRERSSPLNPQLRALDGYNPWEDLVGWLREHGITTVVAGPSPGNLISGRTLIASTESAPLDEVVRVPEGAMVFTLGEMPKSLFAGRGGPESRMGTAAEVRQALAGAKEYAERRALPVADRPPIDLGQEALVSVLNRKTRAVIVAHRSDDILTALRIAKEFNLDLILAGGTEAYLVRDAIRAADVPVLVGPVMVRSWGVSETSNASFENAQLLHEVGIPIGFTSGFEGYVPKVRVVLWEAAISAANGLGGHDALHGLTLGAAQIWGLDDSIGSIEVGKRADLALFDGDPFEYTSHVCGVIIGGKVVSETCR